MHKNTIIMKKRIRPLLVAFCSLALAFSPVAGEAQEEATGEERGWKIVAEGEVVNQDYGAVAEVVRISGTVLGDVYAVGGQIFIDGLVDGDVLALGGVVHIAGEVTQNVRAAGGEVVVSGTIGRNATIVGMNVTFTDEARVQGGVVIGGANVFLSSPVGKEARIAGRNFTLANTVAGDVEAAVENIGLTGKARIEGDFTYWSNKAAQIDEEAVVLGVQERKSPQQLTGRVGKIMEPATRWVKPILGILSFFTTLLFGLLFIRFFPGFSRTTVRTLQIAKWRSLTTGITALLIIPLLFGILIITIVGIPLGFLLLLVSSLLLYGSRIFVMLLLGKFLLGRLSARENGEMGQGLAFFLGLAVYSLLVLIPVVGWFVSLGAMLFGLGAAAETVKEIYVKPKKETSAH